MTKDAKIYNGKKIISSINDVEKTEQLPVRNEIKTFVTQCTKINSKWIKDSNLRPETNKKFLEGFLGSILFDLSLRNILGGICLLRQGSKSQK